MENKCAQRLWRWVSQLARLKCVTMANFRVVLLHGVCWKTGKNNYGGNLAAHACRFHQNFCFKSQNAADPPPPRGVLICCRFLQISARLRKFVIVRQVSSVPWWIGRNKGNLRVNCSALIGGDVGIPGLPCGGQHGSHGRSSAVRRGLLQGESDVHARARTCAIRVPVC